MRLLLVEDDELLGDGIQAVLNQRGFTADWIQDGLGADQALNSNDYDLLVLDLTLPNLSGFEILQRLRACGNKIPVLVLTARSDITDRVNALDVGADDYVVKPFDMEELCARLRALYRRYRDHTTVILRNGNLILDPDARTVTIGGSPVSLSKREFDVLHLLMDNAGRVLSRSRLDEAVSGWKNEVESNAVEVHIHHLRKKLGIERIRTVRGVGYVIERYD